MIVCYSLQGRDLSLKCAFLCQRCGDLIVVQAVSLLSDEVYFRIADFPNRDLVASAEQLQENDILQGVSEIIILPGDQVPPQAQIHDIELSVLLKKLFSFDIVSADFIKSECIAKVLQIRCYCFVIDLFLIAV